MRVEGMREHGGKWRVRDRGRGEGREGGGLVGSYVLQQYLYALHAKRMCVCMFFCVCVSVCVPVCVREDKLLIVYILSFFLSTRSRCQFVRAYSCVCCVRVHVSVGVCM